MARQMRYLIPLVLVGLAAGFVLIGSGFDLGYVIPRRLLQLGAMVVGGMAVALSSITFQTLAGNRILTPAVMGYEAVYLLLQALLVLGFGTSSLVLLGANGNFLTSVLMMLVYSALLHLWLFRREGQDVWLMMLVGIVLTMVIGTFTQFIQLRISPGEFAIFQAYAQVSFDGISAPRLGWSAGLLALVCLAGWRSLPVLDVLALGREQAISLGVDHAREMRRLMALIAVLVAVSASLIGPTAFMGIFVANIAYALSPAPGHRATLATGCAVAIAMFLSAELLAGQVFDHRTTVGILVNLACGAWFLTLMLRRKSPA